MSQELERVYTINLGKVLLSPNNIRAKRAINMIREFARRHMKTEDIKIDEDVAHSIWLRGIKHPPRKIRVLMTKTDEGYVLVSKYEDVDTKSETKDEKPSLETPKVETTSETKEIEADPTTVEAPKIEQIPKPAPAKESKPAKEKPKTPKESKPAPAKESKSKKKSK